MAMLFRQASSVSLSLSHSPSLTLTLCLALSVPRAGTLARPRPPPISKAGWAGGARGVPVPARSSETKGFPIVGLWMVTGSSPAQAAG